MVGVGRGEDVVKGSNDIDVLIFTNKRCKGVKRCVKLEVEDEGGVKRDVVSIARRGGEEEGEGADVIRFVDPLYGSWGSCGCSN